MRRRIVSLHTSTGREVLSVERAWPPDIDQIDGKTCATVLAAMPDVDDLIIERSRDHPDWFWKVRK